MNSSRTAGSIVLLVAEGLLAGLGGTVAFGLTTEYGDVTASRGATFATAMQVGSIALVIVGAVGVGAVLVGRTATVTAVAVAIPALMLLGIWVAGPTALDHKLETQYDAVPQCDSGELGSGPGVAAAHHAQATFETIDHVGWFSRGGSSGVGGCSREMVVIGDTDVVGHYTEVLEADGWTVTDVDDGLRAEKGGDAFEVVGGGRDWTVWTGPVTGSNGSSPSHVAP